MEREIDVLHATDPLREEHVHLWPHVRELVMLAAALDQWDESVGERLRDAVAFLRDHLVPHATAEETLLYPAADRVLGSPDATKTMVADHEEIVRRIAILEGLVGLAAAGPPSEELIAELRAHLYGLEAILALHFRKEEEILLPALESGLADAQIAAMIDAMHDAAR